MILNLQFHPFSPSTIHISQGKDKDEQSQMTSPANNVEYQLLKALASATLNANKLSQQAHFITFTLPKRWLINSK